MSWPVDPKIPHRTQVCFTGFDVDEKQKLFDIAMAKGFQVVGSVTVKLDFLVIGLTPGPMKISKAKEHKVKILTLDQFKKLITTGEIPA